MCLAVPGRVQEIYEKDGAKMGKVSFGGVVKEVCLACLPEITVGEYAIVHVGFAIGKIDEPSALATLRMFEELGILDEELGTTSVPDDLTACPTQPFLIPDQHSDPGKPR